MNENLLSVICVYNNKEKLSNYLLGGLKKQTFPFESILLDNTQNRFVSGAEALNYGARQAHGKYLVFVHQDIFIEESNGWQQLISYFEAGYELIGVSGMPRNHLRMRSNVTTGTHDFRAPANWLCKEIYQPEAVETLDECFFACTRDLYNQIGGFDEVVCDNWHMYSVDFCLSAKALGVNPVVVPIQMHHQSGGKINKAFLHNLMKVAKKHHKIWMSTPCYHFFAFRPFIWMLWFFWQIVYLRSDAQDHRQAKRDSRLKRKEGK